MKTVAKISAVALIAVVITSCSSGYMVVSSRPDPPRYVRSAPPHAGYVWIDGDYYYRGGRYVYRNGYWSKPRPGYRYAPGYWQPRGNGYYWKRGHWRR